MHVQLFELAGRTYAFFLAHGDGSKRSSVVSSLRGQLITLTLKNALSNLPPRYPLAAMSSLELSSVAVIRVVNVSLKRGGKRGFTFTS